MRIFAEIVDASALTVDAILARAAAMRAAGADVIDLGCLPDTPFPASRGRRARAEGCRPRVSVNSAATEELRRGGQAGAGFLLSLTEHTLDIARETGATPVLIPGPPRRPGVAVARRRGRRHGAGSRSILDPILDPIHFGFMASLQRYAELRRQAAGGRDSDGNRQSDRTDRRGFRGRHRDAARHLLGAAHPQSCSSCRSARIPAAPSRSTTRRGASCSRRAKTRAFRRITATALLQLHDRDAVSEYAGRRSPSLAAQVKDANFRIETAEDGIHVYNRDGTTSRRMRSRCFPSSASNRMAPHAFYLGAELMKAEIAWRLGKRYAQDEPLDWGCAVDRWRRIARACAKPGIRCAPRRRELSRCR